MAIAIEPAEQARGWLVQGGNADLPSGDAELVAAANRGDRAAFSRLYERYGPVVHGALIARVPAQDAADLTAQPAPLLRPVRADRHHGAGGGPQGGGRADPHGGRRARPGSGRLAGRRAALRERTAPTGGMKVVGRAAACPPQLAPFSKPALSTDPVRSWCAFSSHAWLVVYPCRTRTGGSRHRHLSRPAARRTTRRRRAAPVPRGRMGSIACSRSTMR